MANSKAIPTYSLAYTGASNEALTVPSQNVQCPYQGADSSSTIDVPDLEAADTEHAVSFGSVDAATLALFENRTGQDLGVRINEPPKATAALVAGLNAAITLASAVGDRFSVTPGASNGGTPGTKYAVTRVDGTTVAVASFDSANALQTLDVSSVTVRNESAPHFDLPTGGTVMIAAPALPAARPLTKITLQTTGAQAGAGRIGTRIFGDPV